jgi:heme-degrading monooxygenase HmoA
MNKRLNTPQQSRNLQKIVSEFLAAPGVEPARAARPRTVTGSYACVWEFRVRPAFVAEFERAYGPDGDWAALFRRAEGYLRTELQRDVDDPLRYLTVDHWESRDAHAAFQREFREAYAQLDDRCEAFTVEAWLIGDFAVRR